MRCQTHAVPHFEALKPAVPPNFVGCCGQQTVETMANPAPYDIYIVAALCLPRQSSNEGSFNLSTQTGMHILVVEALLLLSILPG